MREAIGIVGGMGPAAGLDLFDKIVKATDARSDQEHLPVIMVSHPGDIPDRTEYLLDGVGSNPADAIYDILRLLEQAGATVAGIPCNTAHAPRILDDVLKRLDDEGASIRLINMINKTIQHLRGQAGEPARIGVLSTRAVRTLRIYADALEAAGFDVVQANDEVQDKLVSPVIFSREYGLKAFAPASEQARANVLEAVEHLADGGATAVILGCTELPLAVPESNHHGVWLVDPTQVLARSLIEETYPHKLAAPTS
ncbi:MAG: amino acid racemase [Rhodothermia bacterium]|nr:amino acid racemase [Rhodothermia bacterium]